MATECLKESLSLSPNLSFCVSQSPDYVTKELKQIFEIRIEICFFLLKL